MRKFRVRKPDRPHRPKLTGIAKQEAQEHLLELMCEGTTVTRAAQEIDVSLRTVMTWVAEDEAFREQYQIARHCQGQAIADGAMDIADQPVTTIVEVKRNELAIETRKWYVAKTVPREWGDKVQYDHTILRGVVILPALDYSQQPIPALDPEQRLLPPGE